MAYNNLPFDESLTSTLNPVYERIQNNKAAMIIIDGGVGEGKTTLACHIAEYFQPGWVKDRSDKLLAMGGANFMNALEEAVRMNDKVVVYDEAGDFNTRGALTAFNKQLNRIFETYRQTQKLIILCLPNFSDIDKSLMYKQIMRVLIHVYGRGSNYGRYKVYSLWRTWYIRENMSRLTVPQQAYGMTTPNLYGAFKDLPKDKKTQVSSISLKGKRKIIQESRLREQGYVDMEYLMTQTPLSKNKAYDALSTVDNFTRLGNKKYYHKKEAVVKLDHYLKGEMERKDSKAS